MKKIMITAALTACVAVVTAQTVTSANVVGYSKATLKTGFNMVRMPFVNGTNGIPLQEVFDTSVLSQGSSAANSDNILLWDNAGTQYISYYLTDGSTKATSGKAGKWVTNAGALAADIAYPDTGFFFTRFGVDVEVIMAGEVVQTSTSTLILDDGFNMVANPFTSEWDLNSANIDWIAEGAVAGASAAVADGINLWDVDNTQYVSYYLTDGSTKATSGKAGKWVDNSGALMPNSVGINQGFFYSRVIGAGTAAIDIAQPYNLD